MVKGFMFVKPSDDRKVRDPRTMQHIPQTGARVPEESYWFRRIADGDVVETPEPVDEPPAVKPTKETARS